MTKALDPSPRYNLNLVVAATANAHAIGRHGQLPWRLKKDMAFFVQVTTFFQSHFTQNSKNIVIMGTCWNQKRKGSATTILTIIMPMLY